MKTIWNDTNYGNDLRLTRADAAMCSHSGACDDDVAFLITKPYVKKQIACIDPEQLKKELKEYGAWDDEELSVHEDNIRRWVWISAGTIADKQSN